MHQAFDIDNQLVQIDGVGMGDLLSGIGQELSDEEFAAMRRFDRTLRQAFDLLGPADRRGGRRKNRGRNARR
jgi:hypothetical protein